MQNELEKAINDQTENEIKLKGKIEINADKSACLR